MKLVNLKVGKRTVFGYDPFRGGFVYKTSGHPDPGARLEGQIGKASAHQSLIESGVTLFQQSTGILRGLGLREVASSNPTVNVPAGASAPIRSDYNPDVNGSAIQPQQPYTLAQILQGITLK